MRKTLLLLVTGLATLSLYAEKLEERYVSRITSNGMLFFIKPFELPNEGQGKPAELDITLLIERDSITLNISVLTSNILQVDSIGLYNDRNNINISDFETFFIDKEGKNYIHRYSCKLPFAYWKRLYTNDISYHLTIFAKETKLLYGYSTKEWKKERNQMRQIIQLIERNRMGNRVLQDFSIATDVPSARVGRKSA